MSDKKQDAFYLYRQHLSDWTPVEVRGWWKNRIFIKYNGTAACNNSEDIVELDRYALHAHGFAEDDQGQLYFTPDGKAAEDKRNTDDIATPWRRELYLYRRICHTGPGAVLLYSDWQKTRIHNLNERFVFVREPDGKIGWMHRWSFREGGEYNSGWTGRHRYFTESAMRLTQEEEAFYRRQRERHESDARWRASGATGSKFADAASLLGISVDATADEIQAAYRRLVKAAHPDVGGDPAVFRRLTEARDALLKAVRVSA
jgi:hypothetical protein